MAENLYEITSDPIVVKEKPFALGKEKLRSLLNRSYEQSWEKTNKFKIYDLYSWVISFFFTLIIALCTADFHDFAGMKAEAIKTVAIILTIISGILGIILLIWKFKDKGRTVFGDRDETVNKILEDTEKSQSDNSNK